MDSGALKGRQAEIAPRLATFKKLAAGKKAKALLQMVADLELDMAKLRYQEAILLLAEGRAAPARELLESPTLAGAKFPAAMGFGRRLALAVTCGLAGETGRAQTLLSELGRRDGPRPHRSLRGVG